MLEIGCLLQSGLGPLFGKFSECEVPQQAIRPVLIVIDPPGFNLRGFK